MFKTSTTKVGLVALLGAGALVAPAQGSATNITFNGAYIVPAEACAAGQTSADCPTETNDLILMRDEYQMAAVANATATASSYGTVHPGTPKSIEFDLDNDGNFESSGKPIEQSTCGWTFNFLRTPWWAWVCGPGQGISLSKQTFRTSIIEPQKTFGVKITAQNGSSKIEKVSPPATYRRAYVKWSDPSVKVRAYFWGKQSYSTGIQQVKSEVPGDAVYGDNGIKRTDLDAGVVRAGVEERDGKWVEASDARLKRKIAFVGVPEAFKAADGSQKFRHAEDLVMGICQEDGPVTTVSVDFVQLNGKVESRQVKLNGTGNGAIVGRTPSMSSFQTPAGWCKQVTDLTDFVKPTTPTTTTTTTTPTPATPDAAKSIRVKASSRRAGGKFTVNAAGYPDGTILRLSWKRTGAKAFVKRSKVTSGVAMARAPKTTGKYKLVVIVDGETKLSKALTVKK